jgi:phage terminase large subunit-like protein
VIFRGAGCTKTTLPARLLRHTLGEYNFAGQYQQAPSPQGGGLIKAVWFRGYATNERPEKFERIAQSWDTANKASELSDFSVCTSWRIKGKDVYLLHVLRERMEYPELKRRFASSARPSRPVSC